MALLLERSYCLLVDVGYLSKILVWVCSYLYFDYLRFPSPVDMDTYAWLPPTKMRTVTTSGPPVCAITGCEASANKHAAMNKDFFMAAKMG
ncbi:MAG: hypothetical protein EOO60_10905 [Hymenobacter sp.]|nr:MAG: hypothetical protein EOO60_10905 [Hymenobacter sp.]